MKKFFILFIIILASSGCKDNSIAPINPLQNTENIKFYYYSKSNDVTESSINSIVGKIIILDFSGIYKKYYIIKTTESSEGYNLIENKIQDSLYILNLDNLIIKYNYQIYPDTLPLNMDSFLVMWPGSYEIISWRKNKNDSIKIVINYAQEIKIDNIEPIFPKKYDEFIDSLYNFINL